MNPLTYLSYLVPLSFSYPSLAMLALSARNTPAFRTSMQSLFLVPSPEAASLATRPPPPSSPLRPARVAHTLGPPEVCVKLGGPALLP